MSTIEHPDGRMRCSWPGTDPLYVAYHDTDWGVPERDSRALFEKLLLDGFQAGLSWITILRKRDNFRRAFDGFEPQRIARYDDKKIAVLMEDAGIVRNRAKITGAVVSARAYLEMAQKQDFSDFLWDFVDGKPVQNAWRERREVPVETDVSRRMSKSLAEKGFKFCGPTIVYAFMQAVGMVNDHFVGCCRHAECAALAKSPKRPAVKNPTANNPTAKKPSAKKGDGKMTARPAEPAG
ncbi:MAG: DNA-3-methyladenine glycosylase I [Hyphomicrobiales bacterium]